MKPSPREPVNLLWTGGWDSTYRLLDLVAIQGRAVQPLYVVDRGRRSTPTELATMEKIRSVVARRYCNAATLIQPTRLFEKDRIQPFPRITAAYERLRATAPLGSQYDWLARLAEEHGLNELEMTIHVDDRAFGHIEGAIRKDGDAMVLDEEAASPDLGIFRYYRFPILYKTKRDLEAEARSTGVHDIMMMTWFCFQPDAKGRPCGLCDPCSFAIQENMGHRVPWQGRVRRFVWIATASARPIARISRGWAKRGLTWLQEQQR